MNFLLIGLGSIGRKHLSALNHYYPNSEIFVVDPAYPLGKQALNSVTFLVSAEIPASSSANDVAIVANWGPDHFKFFLELVNAGFKRILMEKPLADSLYELNKPRQAQPHLATPCPVKPCHAQPRLASPAMHRLAMHRLAKPRPACQATLSRAKPRPACQD